jgi:phytoene dehydrogenase-like protein
LKGNLVPQQDALVIGSGPNGFAAAIQLARAGWSVTLYEAQATIGGGMRTAELTLPGFWHDICSAIHPLGVSSPFFLDVPLAAYGLEWIHPDLPLAHPFDDGTAAVLARSFAETADSLGKDGAAWRRLLKPFVDNWSALVNDAMGPLHIPRHPLLLAWFGLQAIQSTQMLTRLWFREARATALFAGIAAHVMMRLEQMPTASFGLVLAAAGHAVGWPLPRRGSQAIANALSAYFESLGGTIQTGCEIRNIDDLPSATAVLFDVTPRQLVAIAGHRLPARYVKALERYRYGSGIFKIDWALREPVPWTAVDCRRAGTVHIGPTYGDIAEAERAAWRGDICERPYLLVAQPSLFDDTRAPGDQHTLWAYCHVPNGSDVDMTGPVEAQLERFAPGFREIVLDRHTMTAQQVHRYNPNYVGGDINGGLEDLRQLFTRPTVSLDPYATPVGNIFLCSSSTPPGGGVHGLCGYYAARSVLRRFA